MISWYWLPMERIYVTKRVVITSINRSLTRDRRKVLFCKPFTLCTTNGFIGNVLGPFYPTVNDAKTMESLLKEPGD